MRHPPSRLSDVFWDFPIDSPLDSSSLLLLLEPDVLKLQRAGDETDLAALLHEAANPPVVVKLLRGDINGTHKEKEGRGSISFVTGGSVCRSERDKRNRTALQSQGRRGGAEGAVGRGGCSSSGLSCDSQNSIILIGLQSVCFCSEF